MFVCKLGTPSCSHYEHFHVYLAYRKQTGTCNMNRRVVVHLYKMFSNCSVSELKQSYNLHWCHVSLNLMNCTVTGLLEK